MDLLLKPLWHRHEEPLWFVVPAHGKCSSIGLAGAYFDLPSSKQELMSS